MQGNILSFNNGYGWISSDQLDSNIYFFYKDVTDVKMSPIMEGDPVNFDVGSNKKGPCAINIQRIWSSGTLDGFDVTTGSGVINTDDGNEKINFESIKYEKDNSPEIGDKVKYCNIIGEKDDKIANNVVKIFSLPLFDFVYIPNFDEKLEHLVKLSQKDDWDYHQTTSSRSYPILFNYLHYTFQRLLKQKKIATTKSGQASCFNTGLVTDNQEDIFFVFDKNTDSGYQPWVANSFFKESARCLLEFGELPDIATYFDDPAELLLDTRCRIRKNIDHIIQENKHRFPEPFSSMEDTYPLRIALEGAIDHAKKRTRRNYRTAVPQFFQGKIQLLLPLCLTNRKTADLALVVSKQNDVYLASTCLTLDMAYNNARLLAKPDSDWLEP